MKGVFLILKIVLYSIAALIFLSGLVLTMIGAYDFIKVFYPLIYGDEHTSNLMAIGLLHAIDAFLLATVFFILELSNFEGSSRNATRKSTYSTINRRASERIGSGTNPAYK